MLEILSDPEKWLAFFRQKTEGGHLYKTEEDDLRRFIENGEYRAVAGDLQAGAPLPYPRAAIICKHHTGKKRTVFLFPREVNYALKLLAWGLRRYDGVFSPRLFSFRRGTDVHQAIRSLLQVRGLGDMYAYKADIHDYFNSVDVEKLLPMLRQILKDDAPLYGFLAGMLRCPYALQDGQPVRMRKGIMAGMPLSAFLANVYLMPLDSAMEASGLVYARYSDDIIIFAPGEAALEDGIRRIHAILKERGLEINPDKEARIRPREPWTFLGFTCSGGKVDVAEASVRKLKAKMRRKTRALMRWRIRNNKDGGKAARAFIRRFNQKLYGSPRRGELTWARWYFPLLNTDRSLRALDHYMQDCIRYLATGTRGKQRFSLRYETMKQWGYRPLVHAYYTGLASPSAEEAPPPPADGSA